MCEQFATQIVWEVVSEIEEQQEMAERSRHAVVSKLQEALAHKTEKYMTPIEVQPQVGAIYFEAKRATGNRNRKRKVMICRPTPTKQST